MDPVTLSMLAMAALGAAKSEFSDKPKAKAQNDLNAETSRLSPWTGLQAGPNRETDTFGQALQFGATGASMASAAKQADMDSKYTEALTKRLNTGGSQLGYGKNLYSQSAMSSPWGFGQDNGPYSFRQFNGK